MTKSMLKRFLTRQSAVAPPALKPSLPSGRRVYAVGDIHGRLDLLDDLLRQIDADEAARDPAETSVIFLGDLIDRGPESAGVVERLRALSETRPQAQFLLGNHEEVFLNVLAGSIEALRFFIRIGGDATIRSYGISANDYAVCELPALLDMLRGAVPFSHRSFLERFQDQVVLGDYAFVHAGIRPGVALVSQTPEDLRWIRKEFLHSSDAFEKVIVHGHTITAEVEERPHRIGLDTGAFEHSRLSAMGFEGTARWVLQADFAGNKTEGCRS